MLPPPKLSLLGTVALLFLLCIGSISSVFARVPLVRRQSNVKSQGAQAFPGVSDDPLDPLRNNILNEQVMTDTYTVCCEQKESLIEKTTTICERVTPEAICDGTLYDCSGQFETLDVQTKCHVSAFQAPSRITDEVIQALPYPLLLCALAGALLNRGPGYHCLEGW